MINRFIKIKASSLLETMIALTIASFVFGMVTVVFVQITNKSVSRSDIQIHELLNEYSIRSLDEDVLSDGDTIQDLYTLKRRFSKIDSVPNTMKAEFFIYGGNNELLERVDKIISVEEDKY